MSNEPDQYDDELTTDASDDLRQMVAEARADAAGEGATAGEVTTDASDDLRQIVAEARADGRRADADPAPDPVSDPSPGPDWPIDEFPPPLAATPPLLVDRAGAVETRWQPAGRLRTAGPGPAAAPSVQPAPQQSSSRLKWVAVIVAIIAVAVVAVVALTTIGSDDSPSPDVSVPTSEIPGSTTGSTPTSGGGAP